MHGDDVHIAFDEIAAVGFGDGRLGLVEAVELVALVVNLAFRRIDVFAYVLVLSQYAPAKGDNLTTDGHDGVHHASVVLVKQFAVLTLEA